MQSIQQRLWPDSQPLVERLGREFFRKLPDSPGVYFMQGRAGAVLYVGKAKNLRHRVGSYRVANPEQLSRRTLRLLHLVENIGWEECGDEAAALRRESELLLALKPRFNRAGVWRGPKRFLVWRPHPRGLQLAVTEKSANGWSGFGPCGAQTVHLHRALLRLLWCRLRPERGLAGMPSGWFRRGEGRLTMIPNVDLTLTTEAAQRVLALVGGGFDSFQQWLLPPATPFEQKCREEDFTFIVDQFSRWRERKAFWLTDVVS